MAQFKKFGLFFAGCLAIVLFFCLPWYHTWLSTKVFCNTCGIYLQSQNLDEEDRMSMRFGTSYNVFAAMKKSLQSLHNREITVLIPPNNYVKTMQVEGNLEMPEPAVFYYFTGIKSVALNSPQLYSANWVLIAENHKLFLRKIRNRQNMDSLVTQFRHYL